jgi:hypothetical protein
MDRSSKYSRKMMMKKVITAILPFILVAQIPFHPSSYIPTEWMKSVQVGLKWTELMMNGYPGAVEAVPEGIVTTTVVIAGAVPEIEQLQFDFEDEFCDVQIDQAVHKAVRIQRTIAIRTAVL